MGRKFCIFCGEKPASKNKEHVLPRWLLKLTGDPKRAVYLGRDWSKPDTLPKREFSFDSFTFPACEVCNSHYARLESQVMGTVNRMLDKQPITSAELIALLDWLDKVRVGLWLGLNVLSKNYRNVTPQFHITTRIAARDRMVCIYEDDDPRPEIAIAGIESPIFHVMPSCFVLTINRLHFFNVSSNGLLARRFGLPHESARKLCRDREGYMAEIAPGTNQIELLVAPFDLVPGGVELYQPILPRELMQTRGESFLLYDTEYARSLCSDFASGTGKVFICRAGRVDEYPAAASLDWAPTQTFSKHTIMSGLGLSSGEWPERLYRDVPSTEDLTPEQKEWIEVSTSGILRVHETMMNHFKAQIACTNQILYFRETT